MKTQDFYYDLPEELIAQDPLEDRSSSRLLVLNKESGAWGVSGVSTDFRDIERTAAEGDPRSVLALDSQAYKVAQYIGQYIVSLGGVDIITFAGYEMELDPIIVDNFLMNIEWI